MQRLSTACRRSGTARRAFTLLELMVVMVILALLAGMVSLMVINRVAQARISRVQSDIQTLGSALEQYRLDNHEYPSTAQGLRALVAKPSGSPEPANWTGRYVRAIPKDPWKHSYE